VAKILAAMKPKAAAVIVARLTDDEIERIVRQLNAKQVAALLAVLPEERAALLSRRLLGPSTGHQGGT
jgi:flagellar motility protein MotE (MotC chaperone)